MNIKIFSSTFYKILELRFAANIYRGTFSTEMNLGWTRILLYIENGNSFNSLLSTLVWLYYSNLFINITLLFLLQENKICRKLIVHFKNFMKDPLTLLRKHQTIVYTPRLFEPFAWKPMHCYNHPSWTYNYFLVFTHF